jgi:D-3-phosphoglycerate dehydrogenase
LAGVSNKILTLCALKGLFASTGHEGVSFVNAPTLAEEHGVTVRETASPDSPEFVNLITVRSGEYAVAGTLLTLGARVEMRIVSIDGHSVEITPTAHMLVVRNNDQPGMIGRVGTVLGEAGISIDQMSVAPNPNTKTALMVLSTPSATPPSVVATLNASEGLFGIHAITLK